MDTKKIQLLLRQHGKTSALIARDLGIGRGVVSRTISNNRAGSSRRVRLYISRIVGFMPSSLFDLPPKDQLFEDFLFCSEPSNLKSDSMVSSS